MNQRNIVAVAVVDYHCCDYFELLSWNGDCGDDDDVVITLQSDDVPR